MIDADGRVLLMDFGLSHDLQISGDIAGTPDYMAPEICAGEPPTVRSDLYAMGVLLLFLSTGDYPLTKMRTEETPASWTMGKTRGQLRLCAGSPTPQPSPTHRSAIRAPSPWGRRWPLPLTQHPPLTIWAAVQGAGRTADWILGALARVAVATDHLTTLAGKRSKQHRAAEPRRLGLFHRRASSGTARQTRQYGEGNCA